MNKNISLIFVSILSIIVCYPLVFIIIGSLMGKGELINNLNSVIFESSNEFPSWSILPEFPTFRSIIEALIDTPEFLTTFWNSSKIIAGVLIGQLIFGIPAAWGFAKYEFPLKNCIFLIYIFLMLLPFQVLMLSEYLVLNTLNMIDTMWAVILPGMFSTFSVFIMHNFFRRIPNAIIEASRIDGANELQIFFHIGIPLGRNGIIAALILHFLEYWSLIEQPMVFFNNRNLWTLSLYIPNIQYEDVNIIFATSFISIIPSFLIFLQGQKHLQSGIAASAVKE